MDTIINLIPVTQVQDDTTGIWSERELTPVPVLGRQESVERSEFYQAAQAGMSPDLKLVTDKINYSGEPMCEVDGQRYTIYRTYADQSDNLFIYASRDARK